MRLHAHTLRAEAGAFIVVVLLPWQHATAVASCHVKTVFNMMIYLLSVLYINPSLQMHVLYPIHKEEATYFIPSSAP